MTRSEPQERQSCKATVVTSMSPSTVLAQLVAEASDLVAFKDNDRIALSESKCSRSPSV